MYVYPGLNQVFTGKYGEGFEYSDGTKPLRDENEEGQIAMEGPGSHREESGGGMHPSRMS
jgi:hypothetical protein